MEFCNVTAGYGKTPVLLNVCVTFRPGEITSVIGLNGSGKTTLLRCASRLMRPQSGTVTLDGTDIAAMKPKELARRTALLPQNRPVPDMRVETMVLHGRYPHLHFGGSLTKEDYRIVCEAMEQCGVYDLRDREVRTLSGGERQRAYIAMAAAQDTDWLLLDEPTASLDLPHRMAVLQLLRTLCRRGKSILLVQHDLGDALSVSDRIVVMHEGRIRALGTPAEILDSGVLGEVFGVRVHRGEEGAFYFTPRQPSKNS